MVDETALNSSTDLGLWLRDFCRDQLVALSAAQLPSLQLPRTYGGHVVAPDVRADLLFTLGHLADAGIDVVNDLAVNELLVSHLGQIDGANTHTFFSYRVAETVARYGPFLANPLLSTLSDGQREQLVRACESSDWIALLDDGKLPRNYAAVLARCEVARIALGFDVDREAFAGLLARLRNFLGNNQLRFLDDSHDRSGRYDIYTADVWLFCEPLADRLDGLWEEGIAAALELVETVGTRDGSAVPWGRSTGVLAVALTIELGALAVSRRLRPRHTALWFARARAAAMQMSSWFDAGVVNAHQYRDQDAYRGPARRLQLTFDVLGKLAWAANELLRAPVEHDDALVRHGIDPYPDIDALICFDAARAAGVWSYRRAGFEFVLPFVGAARSHYYPSLCSPGSFEVPVDADLPCWTPLIHAGIGRYAGGGVPTTLMHSSGTVRAMWEGFPATKFDYAGALPEPLPGSRSTTYRIDGRSLSIDEVLEFETEPDAVTVLVPELAGRPLQVEFTTVAPSTTAPVAVLGLKEWRSSWSEIATTHQLDLDPARTLQYSIRVTPKLRVASTAYGHHYHRSLYGPLADRVVTFPHPLGPLGDATVALGDIDVFHLHWPEWIAFDDLDEHVRIIETLRLHKVPIVWTAHNLTPHDKRPEVFDPVYACWAAAAAAVIHHSNSGMRRMLDRYSFASTTRHEVIPHGHFGELWNRADTPDRVEAERQLGVTPCSLRIGIVGAPRVEKRVVEFLEGVVRSDRDDIQVVCWSLAPGEVAPGDGDARIAIAEQYRGVSESVYAQRLRICDVLALPFEPDGEMLATGTAADALGMGLPGLVTEWEYLREVLGESAILVGHEPNHIASALNALTAEQVETARAASIERRSQYGWESIAGRTFDLFEQVVLDPPSV